MNDSKKSPERSEGFRESLWPHMGRSAELSFVPGQSPGTSQIQKDDHMWDSPTLDMPAVQQMATYLCLERNLL